MSSFEKSDSVVAKNKSRQIASLANALHWFITWIELAALDGKIDGEIYVMCLRMYC